MKWLSVILSLISGYQTSNFRKTIFVVSFEAFLPKAQCLGIVKRNFAEEIAKFNNLIVTFVLEAGIRFSYNKN